VNTGFFNSGTANTGFLQGTPEASALNSSSYVTGGAGAANLGSSLLNSASASTGLNAGLSNLGLLNPANAVVTGPTDAGAMASSLGSGASPAGVATVASGPTPTPPALRTTTTGTPGFFATSGNDVGVRNLAGRESNIPSSGFFNKDARDPSAPNPGTTEPVLPD
jgi:hypothetical protein